MQGAKYDIAMPCATQNEIDEEDANALVKAGVKYVLEGANMPTESAAINVFHENKVIFAPGKVGMPCSPCSHMHVHAVLCSPVTWLHH